MNKIRVVESLELAAPAGHYSHGIVLNGVLYVSGQLGRTKEMTGEEAGDIVAQTRRALTSVEAVVRAAGGNLASIVKVNVYLSDVRHWLAVNASYAEFFGEHQPARAMIPTGKLHYGALIEVDALAAV